MELHDVKALGAVLKALEGLEAPVQERVLRWAFEKLEFKPAKKIAVLGNSGVSEGTALEEFESLADAFGAAHVRTDSQRVLLAAAYLSKKSGGGEFTAQDINVELKNLGHGVNNINKAIDPLKERKPQLVIQTKKSGTSRQARKNYKMTAAGYAEAERLLHTPEAEE